MNDKKYLMIPEFSEGRLKLIEDESKLKVSCGFFDEWWKISYLYQTFIIDKTGYLSSDQTDQIKSMK